MARIIRRTLIALVFGVVLTMVTAWLAMFMPAGNKWYGPSANEFVGYAPSSGHKTFQIQRGENAWHRVVTYWWMQISGRSLTLTGEASHRHFIDLETALPAHLRPRSLDELVMMSWYHEVGWPLPALTCSVHWRTQISNADVIYEVKGGVQLPRDAEFNPRGLPLTPLWPGFAANVLLWALVWLLIAWAFRALRARFRARRNRCVHCGYDRTGLESASLCPECGCR